MPITTHQPGTLLMTDSAADLFRFGAAGLSEFKLFCFYEYFILKQTCKVWAGQLPLGA
jgi:hypothetical protein